MIERMEEQLKSLTKAYREELLQIEVMLIEVEWTMFDCNIWRL